MKRKSISNKNLNSLRDKRIGWAASPIQIARLPHFISGWVTLDTHQVVPGEQVPINWSFFSRLQNVGSVISEVYLDDINAQLYTSPSIPLHQDGYLSDTGLVHAIIGAPPNGGTANDLYHIGEKTLRIDVTPRDKSDLFACYQDLRVVPENIISWWQWNDPITTPDPSATLPPQIPLISKDYSSIINHPYILSGKITNMGLSQNNVMTGSLTLYETEFGKSRIPLEDRTFTLGPGSSQAIDFKSITKNWDWIISGVWAENQSEPRSKTFSYEIVYTMFDSFGNNYPETTSFKINIDVSVSNEKRGYGNGALGVLGAGIIAAIFTFGAGLSAATAIASGLGKKAQDPPEPDYLFEEIFPLRLSYMIPKENVIEPFEVLSQLLNHANHTLIILDCLSITYNRILGAKLIGNKNALENQMLNYSKTENILQTNIKKIIECCHSIIQNLSRHKEFNSSSLREKIIFLQSNALNSDSAKKLMSQGYSEQSLSEFIKNIQDPAMVEFYQDINLVFSLIALSFGMIGREVHRDKIKIRKISRSGKADSDK